MKKLFFIAFTAFICSSFGSYTVDVYNVIKVIGSIKHANSKKALFTGDKILSNEKLTFANDQARAALINKVKGRVMLKATPSGTVSEGLLPALSNVSSRSGALVNSVDLQQHFSEKYLILEGYSVEINANSFPMNEDKFFFLRFNYKGEEISKKLSFEGNELKMIASEILKIDGKAIFLKEGTRAELVYRNAIEKTSETVATFEPVFANEKDLKNECKLILYEIGDQTDPPEMRDQLFAYLTENYGLPLRSNFDKWVKINFEL